jgi:hypothetical protein
MLSLVIVSCTYSTEYYGRILIAPCDIQIAIPVILIAPGRLLYANVLRSVNANHYHERLTSEFA